MYKEVLVKNFDKGGIREVTVTKIKEFKMNIKSGKAIQNNIGNLSLIPRITVTQIVPIVTPKQL